MGEKNKQIKFARNEILQTKKYIATWNIVQATHFSKIIHTYTENIFKQFNYENQEINVKERK